jgi:hypothetical protein
MTHSNGKMAAPQQLGQVSEVQETFAARLRIDSPRPSAASTSSWTSTNLMTGQRFDRELEKALRHLRAGSRPRQMQIYERRQGSSEHDFN